MFIDLIKKSKKKQTKHNFISRQIYATLIFFF